MPLEQLIVTVEHTQVSFAVLYNPEEYTVNEDNNFAVQGIPGLGAPIVQFVNGNQRTLEVELFFDTYDTPTLPKQDVRLQTSQVTDLMKLDSTLHAPPVLRVSLATFEFRCVLSRASQKFIMLMPDGMPVRARVSCAFIEYADAAQEARAANLQTADFTKVYVIQLGDTLSGIAERLYEDPGAWRPIAIANGIVDPRRLTVGQSLLVPALPFVDPQTRQAVH